MPTPKPKPFNLQAAQDLTIPWERKEKSYRCTLHPNSVAYSEYIDKWTRHRQQSDTFREQRSLPPFPYETLVESN